MTNRDQASTFLDKSSVKAADLDHREKINYNIGKYNAVVPQGKQQYDNIQLARERAKNIKWRSLESLDQQLERFEQAFTRRGGKVDLGRGQCRRTEGNFGHMQSETMQVSREKQEHGDGRNSPE